MNEPRRREEHEGRKKEGKKENLFTRQLVLDRTRLEVRVNVLPRVQEKKRRKKKEENSFPVPVA
ncbi:MAG: hypothetical protein PT119_22370 [Aphanizomenon gracile PMC627.10]|nr:hypothetical protein [Aphanizomenon gracile PMC627.10]